MRALAFAKFFATAKAIPESLPATCTCLCKAPAQGTGGMHEARLSVHSMLSLNASTQNQHSCGFYSSPYIFNQCILLRFFAFCGVSQRITCTTSPDAQSTTSGISFLR
jgi:hypothetical protein